MNRLRSIRERKGFTLSQLAGKAGVSARVLSDYEEGRSTMPLAHAKLLAKALWVQIEELMPPAGSVIPTSPVPAPSVMPTRPADVREQPPAIAHAPRPQAAPSPSASIATSSSAPSGYGRPPLSSPGVP